MTHPLALWVTPVAETGGVARHVLDVARAGLPGYRLVVLCPEGQLADDLRDVGAAVLTGPFGPNAARHPLAAAAASASTLRHAIRTLRPDVVHSHLAYADIIAAAVIRGLAVPGVTRRALGGASPLLVSTEHGISGDASLYHSNALRARATAALHATRLRLTDVTIAVAEATARAMRDRWHARDVVVVRNGVDRGGPRDSPLGVSDALRVLSLARLSHEKGLFDLLSAFSLLREDYPGATLTLAGEGPDREELLKAARELKISDSVSFPGHVSAAEAFALHNVVVQLSRWENCSYTLLDAAAAGLGVVATNVGGNGEILPKGCLVEPDGAEFPRVVAEYIGAQYSRAHRPTLSEEWPRVDEMTHELVTHYQEALK